MPAASTPLPTAISSEISCGSTAARCRLVGDAAFWCGARERATSARVDLACLEDAPGVGVEPELAEDRHLAAAVARCQGGGFEDHAVLLGVGEHVVGAAVWVGEQANGPVGDDLPSDVGLLIKSDRVKRRLAGVGAMCQLERGERREEREQDREQRGQRSARQRPAGVAWMVVSWCILMDCAAVVATPSI